MKINFIYILFIFLFYSCSNKIVERTKIINDTIYVYKENYDSINKLNIINDSLNSEIFILRYKLERIKEYNKIAEKGNNIKFLRGWINRVLSE